VHVAHEYKQCLGYLAVYSVSAYPLHALIHPSVQGVWVSLSLTSLMFLRAAYQLSPMIDRNSPHLLGVTATVTDHSSTVNNLKLVFNGDILLLALFSCLVLLDLRRALARFSCVPEWLQGHILWTASPDQWRSRLSSVPSANSAAENSANRKSKGLHTLLSYMHVDVRSFTSVPPHAPAISSSFYTIASLLTRRIMPGFSFGQAVILAIYGAILQYESFYKSNIFTDPIRTGFVGTAQIPFIFALATKNNFLGGLVGLGYEKVIILCHLWDTI
jgi:ferric-chelate reductase